MLGLILILVIVTSSLCDDELVSVVVIYRHGDRTPIQPYPTDPYKNSSYWPVGFGQLTNKGKWQHYRLGKWLRNRYQNFLSPLYSEKDINVRSTDADRTLMSAEANLAGLYPPIGKQIWDPDIPWQPIPIHTAPETEDPLLAGKKKCPKYDKLLTNLFKTPFFVNITHQNHDLYAYLTRYSGTVISTLQSLEYLYNTLYIESIYNLTLPDWTKAVYPNRMKAWAELSFATSCYTQDLARFKMGLLFERIIGNFKNATNSSDFIKFQVYSGHDVTIADVLNTMGAFQYHCPPYASTILMELKRNTTDYFINIFYKNSTELQNITVKGCQFNCEFDDFVKILKPITLTRTQWDEECHLGWLYFFSFDNIQFIVIFSGLIGLFVIIMGILLAVRCYQKVQKEGVTVYMQLPDDEVA